MKCYYHNDLDGRCAGSIVYNFIDEPLRKAENLEMIEIDYKDNINVDVIEKDEQLYIVDFSFKPEVMEKVLQKTNNIIWIDHHKTADEYKYSQEIKGLRITENKKYSGCELTWMFFYPNEKKEQIYIVDFFFKPKIKEKILKKTKNINWINPQKTGQ